MNRCVLPLVAVMGSACGLKVTGDVDGESVVLRSGYFVQDSREVFDDGDPLLQIVFSSSPDACAVDAGFLGRTDGVTDPFELANAAAEFLPADRWVMTTSLRVADVAALAEGDRYAVVGAEDAWVRDEAIVVMQRYLKLLDATFWDGSRGRSEYVTDRQSGTGSLIIEDVEPNVRIGGVLETALFDPRDDDEPSGTVEVEFDVRRCRSVETVLFDLPTLDESAPG